MSEQQPSKTAEVMRKLAAELNPPRWAGIAELRREVRNKNIINRDDPEVIEAALNFFEGSMIRRVMQRKAPDGFPLFPSITVPEKDSDKKRRVYMSRRAMKPLHYAEYMGECHVHAVYWMGLENASARECNGRYGTQMKIPWPDIDADQGAA